MAKVTVPGRIIVEFAPDTPAESIKALATNMSWSEHISGIDTDAVPGAIVLNVPAAQEDAWIAHLLTKGHVDSVKRYEEEMSSPTR